MKKITTWKPDTCTCILHYEWDDAIQESDRIHIPIGEFTDVGGNIIKSILCPAHADKKTKEEHHDVVLEENQRKNKILNDILENSTELSEEFEDGEGNIKKRWKKGMEPIFSFDENRTLRIKLIGNLSTNQKNTIKELPLKHSKFSIE